MLGPVQRPKVRRLMQQMLLRLPVPAKRVGLEPPRGVLALCFALAVGASGSGCPQQRHVTPLPPLELAASANPEAEADFRAAQDARIAGRTEEAERRLKAFMESWPEDPLTPFARLELGRAALSRKQYAEAKSHFEQVATTPDPVLAERARMYAAVAAQRSGDHARALAALTPFLGRTVDPEETVLVLDTLAAAYEGSGDRLSALHMRDKELREDLSNEARQQVERSVRNLTANLDASIDLPKAYAQLPRTGFAWPEVARRLLRVSHDKGDRETVSEVAAALRAEGVTLDEGLAALVLKAERSSAADPSAVGAILPLSGRGREVGEAALRGLLYASSLETTGTPRPRLVYRDDAGDPERAVEALEDLVNVHRVIAVIGPLNAGPAQAVAERAEELGVAVLALNPDPTLQDRSDTTFRLMAEPREEASLLIREGVRAGAKHIGILHPESPFGEAMRQAFEKAASDQRLGTTHVSYAPNATNFVREAQQLEKQRVDAIVIADGPSRVALIAPALSAVGLWSVSPGSRPPEGRAVPYLIPSAGFDPSLARSARRYLQGALFVVPFDANQAIEFSEGYRARFQVEPNYFAAIAHDAYRILEGGLAKGVTTRPELLDALKRTRVDENATALDGFSPQRGPRVPVRLETLLGEAFVGVH